MNTAQCVELLRGIREHSRLDLASIREAGEHGADAGWPGFTYTTDGAEFFRAYRETIWNLLEDDAEAIGHENVAAFVASFTRGDMTNTLDGFECLLAWYALEKVGRHLSDRRESR